MKYGKIIKGNLVITKNCKDDFSEVVEIKGYCDIHSDVELPKLTTIGGYCDIYSDVEFKAPKLTTIGGYCDIHSDVELPKLTTIGGYCNIHSDVEFKAPKAKTNVPEAANIAFKFTFDCFFRLGFVFVDNILTKFISKKSNKNGDTIYKVQAIGKTEISYIIETNGIFSHGATLKEAKDSLIYKISNRDTSMYENYTLDTIVTFKEAIKMYRVITGACEAGTRNFIEGLSKHKKKYTVTEIIEQTKGQYGNDIFKEFFKQCGKQ